jgi:hypothetical protein
MEAYLTNPAVLYGGCATLMFSSYLGIEGVNKKISGNGTKSVIFLWSIISLIIISVISGIHTSEDIGVASPQAIIVMYLLCVVTLLVSSSILYCALS